MKMSRIFVVAVAFVLLGAGGLPQPKMYSPPNEWTPLALGLHPFERHDLPPSIFQSLIVAPLFRLWERGAERIRWAYPDRMAEIQSTDDLLARVKKHTPFDVDSAVTIREEPRCSGKGWWLSWSSTYNPPWAPTGHRELVMERNGHIALIQYMFPPQEKPDANVLASMVDYCATFAK